MNHDRLRIQTLPLLIVLVVTAPAPAQVLSKWGNPVISFGQTPYYARDIGHGNIPGGDGFTPGYGYYPGNNIPHSTYPWLTGPDVPDYTRLKHGESLRPGLPIVAGPDQTTALLSVHVPADAGVWIDGAPTSQRGDWRSFATPPLESGQVFSYEVRARWQVEGKEVERTRTVQVRSGDRLTIDFSAAAKTLPMPRKVP